MLSTLMLIVLSILLGGVITVVVQVYFFRKFFYNKECVINEPSKETSQPFQLPKMVLDMIKTCSAGNSQGDCSALNVIFQFFYHELRDTEKIRRWLRDKLTVEFEELLSRSTLGKILSEIKIRDVNLGSEFPIINSIMIDNIEANEKFQHMDCIDLKLDLSYNGGFELTIDVNMLLGKAAFLSIKVGRLIGQARLQFHRLPYSHWSFSFYDDPLLELKVDSIFQGRPLPQITNLISNQIRKAIRRKHTLPNFKIRYKPFFSISEDLIVPKAVPTATLKFTLLQLSRLTEFPEGFVNCIFGLDPLPWMDIVNSYGTNYLLLDIVITKTHSRSFNATFKLEYISSKNQTCVIVEKTGDCPDLLSGDIVVAVEGRRVTQPSQVSKFVRAARSVQVILRVERKTIVNLINPSQNDADLKSDVEETNIGGDVFQTKQIELEQILLFDETFQLKIKPGDKYLNLTVRHNTSTSIGHINIPLAKFFSSNDQVHSCRIKPMDQFIASNNKIHKLSSQNGFIPIFCFGDVLFRVELFDITKIFDEQPAESTSPGPSRPGSAEKRHEFAKKHLTTSMLCQFCGKKIWFKDAEQCRDCAMICHKKCVQKCRSSNICIPNGSGSGELQGLEESPRKSSSVGLNIGEGDQNRRKSIQPEIIMTAVGSNDASPLSSVGEELTSTPRKSLSSLLASMATSAGRGLKRVGSAHNLQNLQLNTNANELSVTTPDALSKSLPPTPQQTPGPSRKASIPQDLNEEITQLLHSLMKHGTDHGEMLTFAKDTGKTLFENLDLPKRKDKIKEIMDKLNAVIDTEAKNRLTFEREEVSSKDEASKAKSAFMIGKSDEKTQALTILMLHLCAGLQHIQDLEEQESNL